MCDDNALGAHTTRSGRAHDKDVARQRNSFATDLSDSQKKKKMAPRIGGVIDFLNFLCFILFSKYLMKVILILVFKN